MEPKDLPVYKQKDKITRALSENQVIVVESPTGSGKTTQIPIILHYAGFADSGIIGVTQPRRIAAVSVCDYIAKHLNSGQPEIVGYKMRFEDRTDFSTRIKIMTDGILLQEIKSDRLLSRYNVIMVDEAHERSLNIDFILGLLKEVLEKRPEFKVVISSATINPEIFSEYFGECPIIHIESMIYPVGIVYDPPIVESDHEALLHKIAEIVSRIVNERREGDILIFLPGERSIKECILLLSSLPFSKKLWILPLYGRLSKDEQERVFIPTPPGKIKVVIATNIAETSVTIDGITSVIDSGLAKINNYNPRTFTSSLVESPISRASCNQRKGRAGRTQPGTCYRLYSKNDFEKRALFTTEEIYRTDLSEVVLRMAEIGITDFESFDFISPPGKQGIISAIETLRLLDAIDEDRNLTDIGKMMAHFPLIPRLSRMLVEAIYSYPEVIEEVTIAAAFLSTNSPFLLPQGEELAARRAHHKFRDPAGDFISYLKIFRTFKSSENKKRFCEKHYLDHRIMGEIVNIKEQLEELVGELGVPIQSGGSVKDYLCAVATGLMQFVCVRSGRSTYRNLTTEKIHIHPGSVMFRENPPFIVAGEIVKTTRTFARSVSPLKKDWLPEISPILSGNFLKRDKRKTAQEKREEEERQIRIGKSLFDLKPYKGKRKIAVLPWEKISGEVKFIDPSTMPSRYRTLKGQIIYQGYEILTGEKLSSILKIISRIDPERELISSWPKGVNFKSPNRLVELCEELDKVLKLARTDKKKKRLGFLSLQTDGLGRYWFKCSKEFYSAISHSLGSLDMLADEVENNIDPVHLERVNAVYRKLSEYLED